MQEKLLLLRRRKGLSQKEISDYLRISEKQYGSKERGVHEFTSDEMFMLRDLFNCRIEEIFMPRYKSISLSNHIGNF